MGLKIIGTLGILLKCKQIGLIDTIKPMLDIPNKYSDIDLFIYIDEPFDLNKYLRFENAVKRVLKKTVDIVEFRCIL